MRSAIASAALLACLFPAGCGREQGPASPSQTVPTAAAQAGEPAAGVASSLSGFAGLGGASALAAGESLTLPLKLPVSVWLEAQPPEATTSWHDPVTRRVLTLDGFGKRALYFGLSELDSRSSS